jgi:DNA-binding GntR family transcriptional regulator
MDSHIYQTIKNRILYLDYAPGEVIHEQELANEFNTSRTPMREVLSRLEWDNLLTIIPRTGSRIAGIGAKQIVNVFQLRLEIEGITVRWAADQITIDQLKKIDDLIEKLNVNESIINKKAIVMADLDFRNIMFEAINNPLLRQVSELLYNYTIRLWYFINNETTLVKEWQLLHSEIVELKEAFLNKKPAAAEEIRRKFLRSHIERIKSKL